MTAALPDAHLAHLGDEATRLLAVAQATPADTTRGATKTLRFAKNSDLKAWTEQYAEATGLSANGVILLAIQALRAAVERGQEGTTTP